MIFLKIYKNGSTVKMQNGRHLLDDDLRITLLLQKKQNIPSTIIELISE